MTCCARHVPMWEEISLVAEKLSSGATHSNADLKTLRAAALCLENWFTANQESQAERDQARDDAHRYRTALKQLQSTLQLAQRFAGLEACEIDPDTFSRDFVPQINLMGALGDPDYLTPNGRQSMRHIDTRSTKPRTLAPKKQKATA